MEPVEAAGASGLDPKPKNENMEPVEAAAGLAPVLLFVAHAV